jgi:hypothetical protein
MKSGQSALSMLEYGSRAENVVCGVSLRAALVNRVDREIGGRQRREWKHLSHYPNVDFRMNAIAGQNKKWSRFFFREAGDFETT